MNRSCTDHDSTWISVSRSNLWTYKQPETYIYGRPASHLPSTQSSLSNISLPPRSIDRPRFRYIAMTSLSPRRQMRSRSLGLLSIIVLLIACAAFTFGLTFAPCHSSICVEHWFPLRTRIHLTTFYGGVGIVAAYLTAWSKLEPVRSSSDYYLLDRQIPVIGARLSVGGTLLTAWILAFTLATTGYWLPVEHAFWLAKGTQAGWTPYMFRVTWAGVTGHWCDILLGLVFLPVSQNNVISTAFEVQSSTLLLALKVLAYALCAFGLIHGLLYYVRNISLHLDIPVPY
jgi:hypothetical protein